MLYVVVTSMGAGGLVATMGDSLESNLLCLDHLAKKKIKIENNMSLLYDIVRILKCK